jgi:hypothetical protein
VFFSLDAKNGATRIVREHNCKKEKQGTKDYVGVILRCGGVCRRPVPRGRRDRFVCLVYGSRAERKEQACEHNTEDRGSSNLRHLLCIDKINGLVPIVSRRVYHSEEKIQHEKPDDDARDSLDVHCWNPATAGIEKVLDSRDHHQYSGDEVNSLTEIPRVEAWSLHKSTGLLLVERVSHLLLKDIFI